MPRGPWFFLAFFSSRVPLLELRTSSSRIPRPLKWTVFSLASFLIFFPFLHRSASCSDCDDLGRSSFHLTPPPPPRPSPEPFFPDVSSFFSRPRRAASRPPEKSLCHLLLIEGIMALLLWILARTNSSPPLCLGRARNAAVFLGMGNVLAFVACVVGFFTKHCWFPGAPFAPTYSIRRCPTQQFP